MIVRNQSDGSVVMITQNDHAKLAGLFAAHWGNQTFERPRPYTSMMRAAQYHDGGWLRYETNPYLDTATHKSPSFQQVPTDTAQLAAYQWAIDMLTDVDSYTGLMVSKHRTGLWQSRYGAITQPPPGPPRKLSGEIEDFITRNEARQHVITAGLDRHEVAVNYNLLQVWDLLSLYICTHEHHKEHVIEPVPTAYATTGGVRAEAHTHLPHHHHRSIRSPSTKRRWKPRSSIANCRSRRCTTPIPSRPPISARARRSRSSRFAATH